ncbi:MAG: 23S rRNA (guanosine(2251)-2'-O)-methyltransferase RlmB [Nitrospiria bacterium]
MSQGASVIYGFNPVRESLLAEGSRFDKIYLLSNKRGKPVEELRLLAKRRRIPLMTAPGDALNRMAGTAKHQGVVAIVSAKDYRDIDDLLEAAQRGPHPPFLFLIDGVEDPRNLGAILRTVDAAGSNGVVIPSRRAVGLTPVVSKTSAGALAHLPVARASNLSSVLDRLKKEGIWAVGLDMSGKKSYTAHDFSLPVAIVVGGEGKGIRRSVLEKCDEIVSLPMMGHVASLNVAVAVGILSYEVLRQRHMGR